MENGEKYKYHLRPGYDSSNLLIEFINGVGNKNFGKDLFNALKEINPKIFGQEDIWMNDEILYSVDSTFGAFTLSSDIWAVFIIADNNQSCLNRINDLLLKDTRFQKVEIDTNDI